MQHYLIRCGRFFDGCTQKLEENVELLTENDRILEVGRQLPVPKGTEVIDLSAYTVMPGLIDSHVHFEFKYSATFNQFTLTDTDEMKSLNLVHNCMQALQNGYTTIRTTGTAFRGFGCIDAKRAIDRGMFPAARLLVAPHALGTPAGHWDFSIFPGNTNPYLCEFMTQPYAIGSGADKFKYLVRQQIKYGADFIKIMATGGFASPGDDPDQLQLDKDELRAVVETAHSMDKKVAAHAYGSASIDALLALGVEEIEHGTLMQAHTAENMLKAGTHYIPTLFSLMGDPDVDPATLPPRPPAYERKLNKYHDQLIESRVIVKQLILDDQLTMGLGSDIVSSVENIDSWREFKAWRDIGIPALRCLKAATGDNAKICGLTNTGILAPGKTADICAFDSDVLNDFSALEGSHCVFSMKDGTVYKR